MSSQLALPMSDPDRAILSSIRVRESCRVVAKAMGYKAVGALWSRSVDGESVALDEAEVSQRLEETNRKSMKPAHLLALMQRDTEGRILAVLCRELGYEMPERLHQVDDAEAGRRVLRAAESLFPGEVVELLRHKAGLL